MNITVTAVNKVVVTGEKMRVHHYQIKQTHMGYVFITADLEIILEGATLVVCGTDSKSLDTTVINDHANGTIITIGNFFQKTCKKWA